MRTRQDVIDHFTYHPPVPETEEAAKAIHAAITAAEERMASIVADIGHRWSPAGSRRTLAENHALVDEVLRTAALAVFDRAPEVPNRTAALRSLWLARGSAHAGIGAADKSAGPEGAPANVVIYERFDAVRQYLVEARNQAIGAVVLAARGAVA